MEAEVAVCSLGFEVRCYRTKSKPGLFGGCGEASSQRGECLLRGCECYSWYYRWSLGADDCGEGASGTESSGSGAGEIGSHECSVC